MNRANEGQHESDSESSSSTTKASTHLSRGQLIDFLAYELSPTQRRAAHQHLCRCEECGAELAGAQSILKDAVNF